MERAGISRVFIFLLFVYIILALVWWSILLVNKNKDLYEAQRSYLLESPLLLTESEMAAKEVALAKEYQRQKRMIIGEGSVFALSILTGIWFIYKSYRKEISVAQHQKDFLVSITHELNSPLASIKLVLDTLQKRKLDESKEKKLYQSASEEVNRLNSLVNNLLLAAKMEGDYQYNFEKIDLATLIKDAIDKYAQKFPKVEFTTNFIQSNGYISGDQETILSLINNLIENAAKYGNGKVNVELQSLIPNLIVKVSDNGPGIDKQHVSRLFDKFYRGRKKGAKGTGLGLYIVKRIVDAHKGEISVDSNVGQGSTFIIKFPSPS